MGRLPLTLGSSRPLTKVIGDPCWEGQVSLFWETGEWLLQGCLLLLQHACVMTLPVLNEQLLQG